MMTLHYLDSEINNLSHSPDLSFEKLTPTFLTKFTELEYSKRTVHIDSFLSNPSECASESDCISLANISSLSQGDSNSESGSHPSDYVDYLLYVKDRANSIRHNNKINQSEERRDKTPRQNLANNESDDDSSVDSTVGLVNMRQDMTHLNMCDNPGDMWHGLKTCDGKPVVLHPLKSKHNNRYQLDTTPVSGKKWPSFRKMLQTIRRQNVSSHRNGVVRNGPINYSGGFLNINRYIKHHNAKPQFYTSRGKQRPNGRIGDNNQVGRLVTNSSIGRTVTDTSKDEFPMPREYNTFAAQKLVRNATNSVTTISNTSLQSGPSRSGPSLYNDKGRTGKSINVKGAKVTGKRTAVTRKKTKGRYKSAVQRTSDTQDPGNFQPETGKKSARYLAQVN